MPHRGRVLRDSKKIHMTSEKGGFFDSHYRFYKGSMVARNWRKDRDRQITNGVDSDDTAVVLRDIIHFLRRQQNGT